MATSSTSVSMSDPAGNKRPQKAGQKVHPGTWMILCAGLISALLICPPANAQWLESQFDESDMALDLDEALTFQKYPTYPQYLEMMQGFARDYPAICRLDTFGTSMEGRLLLALKISDHVQQDEAEAQFLYTSTMHGNELVGYVLLLRLSRYLLEGYGTDGEVTRLVDSLAIWINPLSNPDGSYYPDNDHSLGQSRRVNAEGFDLNRNFPDPSPAEPDDTTGRPPENQAMMLFLREHLFTLSANIHSGAEVVNYPWDHTCDLHADDAWYRFISREYADEARAVDPEYMALWENGITNGAEWYTIYGGRQDYVNFYLGGREVTLELSDAYRLGSEYLEEYWLKNKRSLINFMSQCTYGIRGKVKDSGDGKPLQARISVPGHDSSYSVVYSSPDHGDFYRLIKGGTYDVVASAQGYLPDTAFGVQVTDYQATWLEFNLEKDDGKTGTRQGPILAGLQIYPNPVSGRLTLVPGEALQGYVRVSVLGLTGQRLLQKSFRSPAGPVTLDVSSLPQGLYILNLRLDGAERNLTFIKQ